MAKLITTNSYFNLFPILTEQLKDGAKNISKKRIIFCEEKISLMTERSICSAFGGSMNTEVYSFGNFLRAKKEIDNVLTKEGSAMVVKQILSNIVLKCFNKSRANISESIYNLIIQLKSSQVSVTDLISSVENVKGVLKNKIEDIIAIYSQYENYINEMGFYDQSSYLSLLPEVIENDSDILGADIYLLGYQSITIQSREIIKKLLQKANSVTAILTAGKNEVAYLNEGMQIFTSICKDLAIPLVTENIEEGLGVEGKFISENIFNPIPNNFQKINTDKIFINAENSIYNETLKVAEIIKQEVIGGARYKDFTVAIMDTEKYYEAICEAFNLLNIPYFLDCKKKPLNHPLITLILSYCQCFIKGFERENIKQFYANPLISNDKKFIDDFDNYLLKNNINYQNIFKPLTLPKDVESDIEKFEKFREKFTSLFKVFDVRKMLESINASEKIKDFSKFLSSFNISEEKSINEQIYNAVISILDQIDLIMGKNKLNEEDFYKIFLSGVNAMELSVIPQYNDAVFVGEAREVALAKAKNLFVVGLTSAVPKCSSNVAILSDDDISALEKIKIKVEPKIKIVNEREVENVANAMFSFREKLFLSYPFSIDGKTQIKSEVISFMEKAFTTQPFINTDKFLNLEQSRRKFAKECGRARLGDVLAKKQLSSLYNTVVNKVAEGEKYSESDYYSKGNLSDDICEIYNVSQKKDKISLNENSEILLKTISSPTAIENFYGCPYKAFAQNVLKLNKREEGKVEVNLIGILMHDIFHKFVENIDKLSDENACIKYFDSIANELMQKDEYSRFYLEPDTNYTVTNSLTECKKYCLVIFNQLKNSDFKPDAKSLEVRFGEGEKSAYPPVLLSNGKVKLKGVIDRIDSYSNGDKKYFRIIDYKTGNVDSSEEELYSGQKLQLYLYAKAISDKQLAGAYYFKVNDNFSATANSKVLFGKTVDNVEIIKAQDKSLFEGDRKGYIPVVINKDGTLKKNNGISQENLYKYMEYAVKVSEKAIDNMGNGIIVPSPYKGECKYCEYKAMCGKNEPNERDVGSIKEQDIINAVDNSNK